MKCVKFAFLALAATLVAVGAYAQATGSIEGRIIDETKAPLPGVTVEVSSPFIRAARFATSDPDGAFKVDMLPPGKYAVKFTLENFATQEQTDVTVGAGRVVTLQVQMRSAFKEAVVVTGSLIPRPTLEAMSPVTTMDIETLQYRGVQRLEDLMTQLPQVFVAQNSSISNGASGTATISLRNLGADRTLVLIDGVRMPAGDAFAVSPDLNFIPASMVKRVDVLTGGASATYGADAVAGVVNFILDKDFEGLRGGVNFGGYQHDNSNSYWEQQNAKKDYPYPTGSTWDGGTFDADVAYGGKFADGKGHASMYIDYRQQSQLLKSQRDYYNCSAGLGATGGICSGSSTAATGRFTVYDPTFSTSLGNFTVGPNNTFVPYTSANTFNYGAYNSIQRPDTRYTAGGFLDYDWNEHFKGYLSVMLMNDYSQAQIAPSGDFYGDTYELNCNNPLMSAQQVQTICTNNGYGPNDVANVIIGRRSVEGGARTDDLTHEAFRLVAGLKGEINKDWSYDVYGLEAQTRVSEDYINDLNINHIQNSLLVTTDPTTGQPVCESGPPCVPWNIFQTGGAGVTQAALNYLKVALESQQLLTTGVVSGKVTGDLKDYGLAFPSASEGIHIALGAEYRKEYLDYMPDQAYQDFLGAGQGGPLLPVVGSYSVKEGFLELLIPIVQDARGAKDLSLSGAYRYSDYNINGSWPTYKVEADWAPTGDFKFRVGYNRATRAPNVVDLFSPVEKGLGGATDPCAGPTPAYTQAQCAYTGMTAAQYGNVPTNPAEQYNTLSGGNVNLKPETADTKTFGIVLTPQGTGITAAFDYWDIKIDNTIGSLDADSILNACAQTGNSALCSLIHRDSLGSLWIMPTGYTITTNENIGTLHARGVDANITYALSLGNGLLNFNLIGTYMDKNEINNGIYSYDCQGYYGNTCGTPVPDWRHIFRISLEEGPATINFNWRYIGGVTADVGNPSPELSNPGSVAQYKANGIYTLPAYNYFDLALAWKLKAGVNLMIGCNNLADKEPPVIPGNTAEGYAAGQYGTYDYAGRYIFGQIQFAF
ncbi:MAG: TonB-dependent receptor [Thermoanaerobaculaceae bacterium]|jgi:outer membrane receptor protein involved in Fe transport